MNIEQEFAERIKFLPRRQHKMVMSEFKRLVREGKIPVFMGWDTARPDIVQMSPVERARFLDGEWKEKENKFNPSDYLPKILQTQALDPEDGN